MRRHVLAGDRVTGRCGAHGNLDPVHGGGRGEAEDLTVEVLFRSDGRASALAGTARAAPATSMTADAIAMREAVS